MDWHGTWGLASFRKMIFLRRSYNHSMLMQNIISYTRKSNSYVDIQYSGFSQFSIHRTCHFVADLNLLMGSAKP